MVTEVTRESKEEVMIFRYRQTDRQTLHHNIYIITNIRRLDLEAEQPAVHYAVHTPASPAMNATVAAPVIKIFFDFSLLFKYFFTSFLLHAQEQSILCENFDEGRALQATAASHFSITEQLHSPG